MKLNFENGFVKKKKTFLERDFTKHDFFGWFLGVNGGGGGLKLRYLGKHDFLYYNKIC